MAKTTKRRAARVNWHAVAEQQATTLQEAQSQLLQAQRTATEAWQKVHSTQREMAEREERLKLTAQQNRARLLAAIDETIADHSARLASLQALRQQFEA